MAGGTFMNKLKLLRILYKNLDEDKELLKKISESDL